MTWQHYVLSVAGVSKMSAPDLLLVIDRTHKYLICSGDPPEVALVMAQAASFLVLNSALPRMSIKTGKMFVSMTLWNQRAN